MTDKNSIAVAFLFFSGGDVWHGGSNYFRSLFSAISADPACQISCYAIIGSRLNVAAFEFPPSVTVIRSSTLDRYSIPWLIDRLFKRVLGRTVLLQRKLERLRIDIVSHCDPRETNHCPTIAWIPDFQHLHLPHFFKPREISARNKQYRMLLDFSALVLVSSNSALADLKHFSTNNSYKARVFQFCSIPRKVDKDLLDNILSIYGIDSDYFFLPNQFWAHKNHRLVLDALVEVRERWPNVKVVCTGALSDYRNPLHIATLLEHIRDHNLTETFRLLGVVKYEHVIHLMARSLAVLNPSLFEGWSTTVEEAKSIGAPLLLSDIPVHREQCNSGEAMFYSPFDSSSLAACMEMVLSGAWPDASDSFGSNMRRAYAERRLSFSRQFQRLVLEALGKELS